MSGAVVLTQEQADFLSNDLAELIDQMTTFGKSFNPDTLKQGIKESVMIAISQGSVYQALEQENFELEENLRELKQVKKYFQKCKNADQLRIVVIVLVSALVGAGIATAILKFI